MSKLPDREWCDIVHEVKSWPGFFHDIAHGKRTHELRLNDRDYRVNDYMLLRLWNPEIQDYSSLNQMVRITAITSAEHPCAVSDNGLAPGYCILSIRVLK